MAMHLRPGTASLVATLLVLVLVPATVRAHPLGNFTVNHFAALRVSRSSIALDVVVDLAEIPAFQERLRLDTNGDGDVDDAEREAARADRCLTLAAGLDLRVDAVRLPLTLTAAGLSFPAGAGGVPTMRTVCEYTAAPSAPVAAPALVTFEDTTDAGRVGWREIVVLGDGVAIGAAPGGAVPAAVDRSDRLTRYPKDLLAKPLAEHSAAFRVDGSGPPLPPFVAPDALPVAAASSAPVPSAAGPSSSPALASPSPGPGSTRAGVPGGIDDVPALFRADLTPLMILGSVLLALALGAGHALTPGHGKTLVAAWLVGVRGTVRDAIGLGLVVTAAHTIGILVLALVATSAESLLPPDVVVRTVPVVAAVGFAVVGAAMLGGELRRRRDRRGIGIHDGHGHGHGVSLPVARPQPDGRVPPDRRSLVAIGLAGGIVPSANALVILLGTILVGRAAFGIVLVVAFGLGMAIVLGGIGALTVLARGRLERLTPPTALARVTRDASLVASIVILGVGVWLTVQAIAAAPAL